MDKNVRCLGCENSSCGQSYNENNENDYERITELQWCPISAIEKFDYLSVSFIYVCQSISHIECLSLRKKERKF